MTFDINGEFGYELFTALPLVNWYKEQGHDIVVNGAVGAKLIYPNIKVNEIYNHREPFLRVDIDGKSYYKQHNHVAGVFDQGHMYIYVNGKQVAYYDHTAEPAINAQNSRA